MGEGVGGGLDALEQDVAREAVRHRDVEVGLEEVVPLAVADEVEGKQPVIREQAQDAVGLLGEFAALAVLGAIAHDTHLRVGALVDVARHEGGHDGVADEVARLCVGVRARIAHEYVAVLARQGGDDARALDTRQQAQLDGARRDRRARVAGGDDRVAGAVLHEVDGDAHRRVLFLAHRHDAALLHRHHLGGVDDFDARVLAEARGVAEGAQDVLRADEVDFFKAGQLGEGQLGAVDIDLRRVVAAHGIECKLHRCMRGR